MKNTNIPNETVGMANNKKLNNYYMSGTDGIAPQELVSVSYCEQDTSVHIHDFIEIVYFTNGVGMHYVDGNIYNVSSGSVCVMNSNVRHHYYADRAYCDKLAVKNIIFFPEFLECDSSDFFLQFINMHKLKFQESETKSFFHIFNDQDKEIEKCFSLIQKELKLKKNNYLDVVRNLLEAVLIILMSGRDTISEKKKFSKNHLKIEESIEYLNHCFKDSPTLKDIANKYGFSPEYYSKLFREFTGKHFGDFVQEMKCDEAERLLLKTDYTNETIAQLSGFGSVKNFYQQFKKHKGVTPREYIKLNQ